MIDVPLNMSIDMADPVSQGSPLPSGDAEDTSSAFDSSDITETPPFIPSSEWGETAALAEGGLGDTSQLYYEEGGCRGGPDSVVDDDWVQGLYDMEGMS